MSVTQRAERLRIDTRLAMLENIRVLRAHRRVARQQGDARSAGELQDLVDALLDRLDDLSAVSLDALEESAAVETVVISLNQAADRLADEADTMTDLQAALVRGTQAVQRFTQLINDLRNLAPIPA